MTDQFKNYRPACVFIEFVAAEALGDIREVANKNEHNLEQLLVRTKREKWSNRFTNWMYQKPIYCSKGSKEVHTELTASVRSKVYNPVKKMSTVLNKMSESLRELLDAGTVSF